MCCPRRPELRQHIDAASTITNAPALKRRNRAAGNYTVGRPPKNPPKRVSYRMLSMKDTWYQPTAPEELIIEQAGVIAAFNELKNIDSEHGPESGIASCLMAFKAAKLAIKDAKAALLSMNPGCSDIRHFPEINEIVCSAMAAKMFDLDPTEISPRSEIGWKIHIMMSAAVALNAIADFEGAIRGEYSDYCSEEAAELAEKANHAT